MGAGIVKPSFSNSIWGWAGGPLLYWLLGEMSAFAFLAFLGVSVGSGCPGGCRPGILGSSQLPDQGWGHMELPALLPSEHLTPCCSQLPSPGDSQQLCPSYPMLLQGKSYLVPPQTVRDRNVGMFLLLSAPHCAQVRPSVPACHESNQNHATFYF